MIRSPWARMVSRGLGQMLQRFSLNQKSAQSVFPSALLVQVIPETVQLQQQTRSYAPHRKKIRKWPDMATRRAMYQELHWHRAETIKRNPLLSNMDDIRKEPEETLDDPDTLYKTIDIECRGHDKAVLNSYQTFALTAAKHLDILVSKTWEPRRILWRQTVLKSVHVYKKHRVQYETRTNFKCFQLKHLTGSTADTFLEYIQRNLPEGVAMKITKTCLQLLPEHVKPPESIADK